MIKKLLTIFICVIILSSCSINEVEKTSMNEHDSIQAIYHKISADEAHEILASGENFILLDVRTDEEYKENRIDGAILIPDYEITGRAESELPDKNSLILIYCRSGRRSEIAAKELVRLGYTGVYDFGGIIDWSYETIGD